ncbi:hypothetical protein B0H14DRAFT_330645 [Mycena olivaceomarginata]|nr:hypothetical protein B0H14DRAFT_330645 [Mycena olivaceomarginata]
MGFSGSLLPILAAMKLRCLGFDWPFLFIDTVHPHQPMFSSLTHLFILGDDPISPVDMGHLPRFLSQLPVLTHFAIINPELFATRPVVEQDILVACKPLRVLILNPQQKMIEFLHYVDNVRLVYMDIGLENLEGDWVAGTRGGIDFWVRAEAFVEKKRRGEIQPSSCCWIEAADDI